jgi:hypothetical protein
MLASSNRIVSHLGVGWPPQGGGSRIASRGCTEVLQSFFSISYAGLVPVALTIGDGSASILLPSVRPIFPAWW